MKEIDLISENFFVILEEITKDQHFTSWTKKSLNFCLIN